WIAAAAAALFFHHLLVPYIEPYVGNDLFSVALSAAAIFFITLIVVSFITIRISDFVLESGAGPIDRTLGFAFGAARGLLIVSVALMIFNGLVKPENRPVWVAEARSLPVMTEIGNRITAALPKNVQQAITDFFGSRATAQEEPNVGGEADTVADDDAAAPAVVPSADDTVAPTQPDTSGDAGSTTPPTVDQEELSDIPQEDSRNVERIINTTPAN
ncbi:MAG: CvpA family protein, partial [Rhizobiales bacterium]|nr:CvpA family protein [Hyphomicrobiales bacterium]